MSERNKVTHVQWLEYCDGAKRTVQEKMWIEGDQDKIRFLYAFCGMISECAEIAEKDADLIEEFGDLFWFIHLAESTGIIDVPLLLTQMDVMQIDAEDAKAIFAARLGAVDDLGGATHMIKGYMHGKADAVKQVKRLVSACAMWAFLVAEEGGIVANDYSSMAYDAPATLAEVLGHNIEKLRIRHPEGFTIESDKARADKS
jgi:hypothetical protein